MSHSLYAHIPERIDVKGSEAQDLLKGLRGVIRSTCYRYKPEYEPLFFESDKWLCVHCPRMEDRP